MLNKNDIDDDRWLLANGQAAVKQTFCKQLHTGTSSQPTLSAHSLRWQSRTTFETLLHSSQAVAPRSRTKNLRERDRQPLFVGRRNARLPSCSLGRFSDARKRASQSASDRHSPALKEVYRLRNEKNERVARARGLIACLLAYLAAQPSQRRT